MPRKKTFEEVAAAFSEAGWVVSPQEYGGAHASLRAICPNGHEKTTQYHILATGNLICKQCVKLDRMNRTCCMCRNKVLFASKIEKGLPICRSCYQAPLRVCALCEELKPTNKFDQQGNSICKRCYRQPCSICCMCGENKPANARDSMNRPVCVSCYVQPPRMCDVCGETGKIQSKDLDGCAVCAVCYDKLHKRSIETCSRCLHIRRVAKRFSNGSIYCKYCYLWWRYHNDDDFRIGHNLRSRINQALYEFTPNGKTKTIKKYGIDIKAIIDHLGSCPGKRSQYHIDHIFPLVAFDLTDSTQIKAAMAPENHRWLTKEHNLSKNASYDRKNLEVYLEKFRKENV